MSALSQPDSSSASAVGQHGEAVGVEVAGWQDALVVGGLR